MRCTLCRNHIVLIPIQPTVEVEDSFSDKTVGMKDIQTSRSGKFYNTNLTVERSTLKYLKCSYSSFFLVAHLVEGFDIHKVDVIVGIHV